MKKLIPFDIAKAKAGAKVVTSTGMDVRIICFDRKGSEGCPHLSNYPIVGLVMTETGNELLHSFTANGKFCLDEDGSYDLFILEEEKYEFKPFDKVLVRDYESDIWKPKLFCHYKNGNDEYPFITMTGCYKYCIPYEGNEDLCFTNNSPK